MAYCLMAPGHYLNQCWRIISQVLRYSLEGNHTGMSNISTIIICYNFIHLKLQPYPSRDNESTPTRKLVWWIAINSLAPGRSECDFPTVIFNRVLLIGIFRSSYDNALRWMPQDLTDDQATLVQVMAWCRQATSHYLSQCWPTRPQWVKWIG